MTRRSIHAALAAVVLSLIAHALGLGFTASEDQSSSTEDSGSDLADAGGAFEDFAETITEPAEPEPAPVPDPPSVTSPEQAIEETPTSQAQVASDNPRNVTAPDTGAVDVIEPDAAEPSESAAPAPETAERSGGEDDSVADVAVSQPVEPDTEAVAAEGAPEGTPDENPDPAEARASEVASVSAAETVSSVAPTPDPSPNPAIDEPELQQPVLPEITVAPEPDDPEALTAEESEDESGSAVTSSLRPPKERPSVVALGEPDGVQQQGAQTGSAPGEIESPLAAYKRTGVDPFASGGGGARSGTTGFSGSRNPGNARTTNYIGEVLVQLNRSPVVHPSARGTARVSFEINPDGTVAWVSILGSTGSQGIERAAAAQVRSAAPFPPPPQGTSQRLVFVYRNR